jgi:hypothetical protein
MVPRRALPSVAEDRVLEHHVALGLDRLLISVMVCSRSYEKPSLSWD